MYPLLYVRYNLGHNRWRSFLCAGLSNRGKRGGKGDKSRKTKEKHEKLKRKEKFVEIKLFLNRDDISWKRNFQCFDPTRVHEKLIKPCWRYISIQRPDRIRENKSPFDYSIRLLAPSPSISAFPSSFGSISARAGKQGIGGGRRKGGNTLRDGIACLFWFIRIRHELLTYLPKSGLTPASF